MVYLNKMTLKHDIQQKALELGFDTIGFALPSIKLNNQNRLDQMIKKGEFATMAWIADRSNILKNPKQIWPHVQSIIVLGINYKPNQRIIENALAYDHHSTNGYISIYARHKDYHNVVKKKLKQLSNWLINHFQCQATYYVDTAPVMEKAIASQSGLGWQGKNTCIITREFGSFIFLGEIFTSLFIEPNQPQQNECGNCQLCMEACPTGAIYKPYHLDPRKCISYLTIEHKQSIPNEFYPAIRNRIYGCDTCQLVCPYNQSGPETKEEAFIAKHHLINPDLLEFLKYDENKFNDIFAGSPIKRIGFERFMRNVVIALINITK